MCTIIHLQRNLTEYYNAVDANNMMIIFASMLCERRIIFTSNKLTRLSACVQTANDIIYPMIWQHIFIPVLPMSLIDYLSAPIPFLIGVPAEVFKVSFEAFNLEASCPPPCVSIHIHEVFSRRTLNSFIFTGSQ